MVSILTFSDRVEDLMSLHEQFITSGVSRLIGVTRFAEPVYAYHFPLARIGDLMYWRSKNSTFAKPTLHLMIAFHPSETPHLTDPLLREIAGKFMDGLGFTESPYLIYRRNEHAHLHIHIITVGFNRQGKAVSQSFMQNRCNTLRKKVEHEYGLVAASGRREWTKRQAVLPLNSEQP